MEMLINSIEEINLNEYKNLIFWVGAGVSYDEPTSLPLGNRLTEIALRSGLDEDCNDFISSYKEIIKKLTGKDASYPRLETIFQIYKDVDDNEECNYMQILKLFSSPSYNVNHASLASLIKDGKTVFTSNFDRCIEKAHKAIFNSETQNITHFHGTYDCKETIGITIDNIARIDDDVKQKFDCSIKEKNLHIFVGYSLSDDLDINPYLLEPKESNSDALYIIHSSSDIDKLSNEKREILKRTFLNVYELKTNTKDFLMDLSGVNINNNNSDKFCFEKEYNKIFQNTILDKNAFRIYLSDYIGVIPKGIDGKYEPKHQYTQKLLRHIKVNYDVKFNECEHLNRLGIYKNDTTDVSNLNRLARDYCIKYCENMLDGIDAKEIRNIISISDDLLKQETNYQRNNILLRINGILNATIGNYKLGYRDIKDAIKRYDSISNIDGIIGSYIDLFFCQKVADRNKNDFNFLNHEDSKKIEYVAKIINEEIVQPKHKVNYNFLISCFE